MLPPPLSPIWALSAFAKHGLTQEGFLTGNAFEEALRAADCERQKQVEALGMREPPLDLPVPFYRFFFGGDSAPLLK